jgi:hypothetical protein
MEEKIWGETAELGRQYLNVPCMSRPIAVGAFLHDSNSFHNKRLFIVKSRELLLRRDVTRIPCQQQTPSTTHYIVQSIQCVSITMREQKKISLLYTVFIYFYFFVSLRRSHVNGVKTRHDKNNALQINKAELKTRDRQAMREREVPYSYDVIRILHVVTRKTPLESATTHVLHASRYHRRLRWRHDSLPTTQNPSRLYDATNAKLIFELYYYIVFFFVFTSLDLWVPWLLLCSKLDCRILSLIQFLCQCGIHFTCSIRPVVTTATSFLINQTRQTTIQVIIDQ